MVTDSYQLITDGNRLFFKTASFRAEKTSVLHAGVYTKEFTSMLFASAFCIVFYMLTDMANSRSPVARYLMLVLIFVIAFLGARKYIFNERQLKAVFDNTEKVITITRSGLITTKKEMISFGDVKSVDVGSRTFRPVNLDGIDFVQKISAQHGSAVPELSDTEEFVTLSLTLSDGAERLLYAAKVQPGKIDGEPEIPLGEIRSFLGIHDAVRQNT